MIGRVLLATMIGAFACAAHAQVEHVAAPPAPPAETAGEIAFRDRAQFRMTVPVRIGEAGPFGFVVDTGAERTVVSRELAQSLGLAAGPSARLFDFAGLSIVGTAQVPALSVSPLAALAMHAPMLDAVNLGASGLIGIDLLQGHKVTVDFMRRRMTVKPSRRRLDGDIVVGATDRLGQLIVTSATFYGQPIAVIVDTGSWVSVGNRAMLALARRQPRRFAPIVVTSVTGKTFAADFVTVDNVKVGGMTFDRFGLVFADVPPFALFGLKDKPALILGMSALKLFRRVDIDFANRQIAFNLLPPPIDFSSACHITASSCRSY